MTFTKTNEKMEKVMKLIDMGILPFEDKDGAVEVKMATDNTLLADSNVDFKKFLFRDKAYNFEWEDMFGEKHYEYGEEGCFATIDHYEYTLEKNRRAERRRQLHKHKKATINGKTVKAYGKEGKFWLNNDERIAYGKQLINGKFVDDIKEAGYSKKQGALNGEFLTALFNFYNKQTSIFMKNKLVEIFKEAKTPKAFYGKEDTRGNSCVIANEILKKLK